MTRPESDREFRSSLRMQATRRTDGRVTGHVFDPVSPDRRFVIELLLDGYPAALARADLFDHELARDGAGDGCYGFVFFLERAVLEAARMVEIRLANGGEIVGAPLALPAPAEARELGPGEVWWEGGLRFSGWVADDTAQARTLRAILDGAVVAEALATGWTHVGEGAGVRAYRRFDLWLPSSFADGRARRVAVIDQDGAELPGSPCAFVAFSDGLARFIADHAEVGSEAWRGPLLDRLFPQSTPFAQFDDWRRAYPTIAPAPRMRPKIAVALVGPADVEASVASLRAQQGCDWVAGALDGGVGPLGYDAALLRDFLTREAGDCAIVAFAPAGAVLSPHALAQLAAALDAYPEAPLAYTDFTLTAQDGAEWPVALPAFDYELLLEQGSGALFFAARADYVHAATAAGATDPFRLFLHGQECRRSAIARVCGFDPSTPVHQPGFLAHLPALDLVGLSGQLGDAVAAHLEARRVRARLVRGSGAALPSVRVTRAAPAGKVSIVIPTRDDRDKLKICCDSVARTVDLARHELIVIDNDCAEAGTLALLDRLSARGVRVQRVGGAWNLPRLVEAGASVAGGEFLLVLDPSVEALEEGWLDEMLGRMAEPDVGAVGPVLVRRNGLIAHGGHVLGPGFAAAPAFQDRLDSDPGYADRLHVAHEVSAVSTACLLTERQLFLSVGGFDGALFPHHFHDVDYGLKLRARGARLVLTPYARLLHREKTGYAPPEGRARETDRLRAAWGDALAADPAYHPLLSLDGPPFSALAWPPRPADPRQTFTAPARAVPPGF